VTEDFNVPAIQPRIESDMPKCPHEDVWSISRLVIELLTIPREGRPVDVSTRRVADKLVCGGVDMRARPHVELSSCPRVDVRTRIGVRAQ
jgi:hypothetical protein